MSDVLDDDGKRVKRFKYQTYTEQLKDVHAPSAFTRTTFEELSEEEPCLFHAALLHWSELNLSSEFVAFTRRALPLSQSLPLLIHSWKDVLELCLYHIDKTDEEGLRALLDLLQKLLEDLRSTLKAEYENIVQKLFKLFARRLSPDALSILLSTLTAVFRHLLFSEPSQAPEGTVIENTWTLLCENVTKCDAETKRAAAEVWSPVLRRLKKDDQTRCVKYMLTFSARSSEIVAWALVASAKSVAQTLHTCASPITGACADFLFEADEGHVEASMIPIRRFLTALVHHCAKPAQFSIVTETIISKLTTRSEADEQNLHRILHIIFVPCSVRQGSRISANELSQIIDASMKISYEPGLLESLSGVITSCLCASTADLAVWMGAGRRAVEKAWEKDTLFAVTLTGLLSESGWKAHKQFALPVFLEKVFICLEGPDLNQSALSLHLQILRSLAELASCGSLEEMGDAWRDRLAAWIRAWLMNFKICESSILLLREITRIIPSLSEKIIQNHIVEKAKELLEEEEGVESRREANTNERAWVFGKMLDAAYCKTLKSGLVMDDIVGMVFKGIVKWSDSECALSGLLKLVQSNRVNCFEHPLRDAAVAKLLENLKAQSQPLRRCSLEILSVFMANTDAASEEALARCFAAEKIPLNVEGARERALRTSRIGQNLRRSGTMFIRILSSWLLGQLKVNLRPIWTPSIQALKCLSDTHEEILWGMLIGELRTLVDGLDTSAVQSLLHKRESHDETAESERSWRDPSSFKLRVLIRKWVTDDSMRDSIAEEQSPQDRFDSVSYEAQLLGALTEASSMSGKNNRDLVPLFLSFVRSTAPSQKASRARLLNWLNLFSNLSNPKAFYQSDVYRTVIIGYLSHPDRSLQSLSLECLLQYRTPVLMRYSDMLRHFLDDANFRNELALLDLLALETNDKAELVPIIVRLFYGLMLERGGRGRGFDRRSTLLSALSVCEEDELHLLVDLMLETFSERTLKGDGLTEDPGEEKKPAALPQKQQIGFLTFLGDVLKHLANRISSKDLSRLVTFCLDLTSRAQASLQTDADFDGQDELLGDLAEGKDDEAETILSGTSARQTRTIRQLGLKRIIDFFKILPSFDFSPYMSLLFETIISPRISFFNQENVQAPSVLLQLFEFWTMQPETAMFLVQYDTRTLPKVYDCLLTKNVKPSVVNCIIEMAERLLSFAQEDNALKESLVSPFVPHLLSILTQRAAGSASRSDTITLFPKEIALLSRISPFVSNGNDAASLAMLLLPHLRQVRNISDQTRIDLLSIISNIMTVVPANDKVLPEIFAVLSRLLQVCRGRQVRAGVLNSLKVYSEIDTSVTRVISLLISLNAYSTTRIENPDFEARLAAFTSLNTDLWKTLSEKEWPPLIYNMLFFIQDDDELSIRTNASFSIRLFVDTVADSESDGLRSCFSKILFTGLKRCLKNKSELVRNEVVNLLAYVVQKSDGLNVLKDLQVLLADGDEEANFFNNIFHIQIHRRTRALRRLADFCDEPGFRSSTLQDIIVPILRGFIAGAGSSDHHLVNEAITTLGRVAKHLTWPSYYALAKYYLRMTTDKSQGGRTYTRALVAILEAFHFSVEDKHEGIAEESDDTDNEGDQPLEENQGHSLQVKIRDAVKDRLLPSLLRCLEHRDEIEDERRIPIAIGIASVVLHLPDGIREEQASKLLLVVSPMFRSKAQSTRDLARETLYRIAIILGPNFLPSIIRHLREALLRGPHLHILAFVVHSLLVHVTSSEHSSHFTKLDACVTDAVHVSTEVIFGQSGKDLQSDTFKSSMKEVKSSTGKGMDTFAILAKYISPAASRELLLPLKAIMQETESAKTMHTVEELLRKMSSSLVGNTNFSPADILVFCHTLISQNAQFFQQSMQLTKRKGRRKGVNDAIVQLKRKVDTEHDHYAHNSWRFISFGLDLFVTAFKRGRFDFHDDDVLSRLKPLVQVIGNSLYASNGNVVSSGIKAIAQLIKCPLKNVEDSIPIFVRQALQIIRSSGNTESDLSQTTLKVLATMIRDCQGAQVKEKDLVYLLELLSPDLEEPERQATTFTVLRAILSRKFVVPEIYDLMGRVEQIMVTSQSASVQEQCRAALLQFLLDYPQGKTRLQRQFAFLAKNLSYEFESGRLSVMEFLTAAVAKFNDDIIAQYAEMLFVALVLVVANDDSGKCREKAAQLIKALVMRLQEAQLKVITSLVHSWASSNDNATLSRVSSQMYGLILDTLKADARPYLPVLLLDLRAKLQSVINTMNEELDDEQEEDNPTSDWQLPYQTIIAYSKVFIAFPELISSSSSESSFPWQHISVFLLYPHKWVRTATCRLLGTFFATAPIAAPSSNEEMTDVGEEGNAQPEVESMPFSISWTRKVANALALQLKSENLDEALGTQVVKNLFFIGKCLAAASMESDQDAEPATMAVDEERNTADDIEEDDDDEDDEKFIKNEDKPAQNLLPWLFSKLSFQARAAHIARQNRKTKTDGWFHQLSSIFKWFAAMASYLPPTQLSKYLPHILSPVYRVSEDDIITRDSDAHMDTLKVLTAELTTLLQSRVGVPAFAAAYSTIRQRIAATRSERKTKRAVQIAVDPVAAAKRKKARHESKKEGKRRKMNEFTEKKARTRFAKRRKVD